MFSTITKLKVQSMKNLTPLITAYAALLLLGIGVASPSNAAPLVLDAFTRTGQTDALTAPFAVFGGATTAQQWSGYIEVIVSDWGYNFPGSQAEDAFYSFAPASPYAPMGNFSNGLQLSFTGCSAPMECGSSSVLRYLTFSENIGQVTSGNLFLGYVENWAAPVSTVMQYNSNHVYDFVIDVGANPSFLTLGFGDGGVFDNSGQFDIQLFSVTPTSPVPEPETYAMLLAGLGLIGFAARRRDYLNT